MHCEYSQYHEIRYRGYMLVCAFGVRYCSYSRCSQYLGLLSTGNILVASTPITLSVLGLRFVLEHLSVMLGYPEHQETFFWGDIFCMFWILPVTNCYGATSTSRNFFGLTLTSHTLNWLVYSSRIVPRDCSSQGQAGRLKFGLMHWCKFSLSHLGYIYITEGNFLPWHT